MLAWIGQVVTLNASVCGAVCRERVPGQPRRRRPAPPVRWRQYACRSRVASHDVSHCPKRRHHALRPARVEAGTLCEYSVATIQRARALPHRARLHRTRAHRWRASLDSLADSGRQARPGRQPNRQNRPQPPERVNAPEKPQRRRPHWPRPSLPRPSSPAVTTICDEHGGDGGTLSDGTPRCPQCRQRRAPP